MSEEHWRPVVGYEGLYEVSDLGRVRSVDRVVTRVDGVRARYAGKLLVGWCDDEDGYRMVRLCRGGRSRECAVHRLVMPAFRGPRPAGLEVCHGDGNPANNELRNLRYDTRRSNNLDAVRHGTHRKSQRVACPRRHPLQAPNLHPGDLRRGRRKCLACDRAHTRLRDLRARGLDGDLQEISDRYFAAIVAEASGVSA